MKSEVVVKKGKREQNQTEKRWRMEEGEEEGQVVVGVMMVVVVMVVIMTVVHGGDA